MLVAEVALLEAIVDAIRAEFSWGADQVAIELADQVPARLGDEYIAVTPDGLTPGPRHRSSGRVIDVLIAVRVTYFRRITSQPRDSRRSIFADMLTDHAERLERVVRLLDTSYTLTAAAKAKIDAILGGPSPPAHITAGATAEWPEPLREWTIDPRPQVVLSEPYDAATWGDKMADPVVALSRGVRFSGARYMQTR